METPGGRAQPAPLPLTRYTVPMTTQTSPADNERLGHLEGVVEQILARLDSIERRLDNMETRIDSLSVQMTAGNESLREELRSQRTMFLTAFAITWASILAGFIAIFAAILNT